MRCWQATLYLYCLFFKLVPVTVAQSLLETVDWLICPTSTAAPNIELFPTVKETRGATRPCKGSYN
jgi:hypothetical protein